MKLSEIQEKYKTLTEKLSKLSNERTKVEERLNIKKEELNTLKKALDDKGINTGDIENEYLARKKDVEDKVQKLSEDLEVFEKTLQNIKTNI